MLEALNEAPTADDARVERLELEGAARLGVEHAPFARARSSGNDPRALALAMRAELAFTRRIGRPYLQLGNWRLPIEEAAAKLAELDAAAGARDWPLTPSLGELERLGPEAFTAQWSKPWGQCITPDDQAAFYIEESAWIIPVAEVDELVARWGR